MEAGVQVKERQEWRGGSVGPHPLPILQCRTVPDGEELWQQGLDWSRRPPHLDALPGRTWSQIPAPANGEGGQGIRPAQRLHPLPRCAGAGRDRRQAIPPLQSIHDAELRDNHRTNHTG